MIKNIEKNAKILKNTRNLQKKILKKRKKLPKNTKKSLNFRYF